MPNKQIDFCEFCQDRRNDSGNAYQKSQNNNYGDSDDDDDDTVDDDDENDHIRQLVFAGKCGSN